jgi:hypothetical protein
MDALFINLNKFVNACLLLCDLLYYKLYILEEFKLHIYRIPGYLDGTVNCYMIYQLCYDYYLKEI